jgi:hypothetical protein
LVAKATTARWGNRDIKRIVHAENANGTFLAAEIAALPPSR